MNILAIAHTPLSTTFFSFFFFCTTFFISKNHKKLSVQFSHSVMSNSLQPRGLHGVLASLSIANSWSLLKLISIESVMPSNPLILCHPLLLPSIFPRVFSNESVLCIRWSNIVASASASVLPMNIQD